LDTGDMLLKESIDIAPEDNAQTLHDRLASLGSKLIVQALDLLCKGGLTATAQPDEGVTYAEKILKPEATLDVNLSATQLCRRIQAFNPFPGATIKLPGLNEAVKVWHARVMDTPATGAPGEVMAVSDQGIDLVTGSGVLRLLELQRPGAKRQPVATFVRSYPLADPRAD